MITLACVGLLNSNAAVMVTPVRVGVAVRRKGDKERACMGEGDSGLASGRRKTITERRITP